MAEGATFFFDTNIQKVVDEIVSELKRLQKAQNAETKGTPQDTSRSLRNAPDELGKASADALRKLEAVRSAAERNALKSGQTLTSEFRKVLSGHPDNQRLCFLCLSFHVYTIPQKCLDTSPKQAFFVYTRV